MARTAQNLSTTADASTSHARNQVVQADWRSTLARSGLVAKGVLYAALGVIAINVASGEAASQSGATKQGAIELVASQPLGQWLLVVLTVGLFALAAWQLVLVFTGDPVEGSEPKNRVKYAGKTTLYLGTAMTSLSILMSHWGSSAAGAGSGGGSTQQQAAATVMSWPGGPWLVGLGGLAVIALAVFQVTTHVREKAFMRRLARSTMSSKMESGVRRAGQWGYAARAVVFTIVGVFLLVAAVQHEPQEAVGLSGALTALAERGWGQAVLWLVAFGLFLYGCFCFAEARYRRAA